MPAGTRSAAPTLIKTNSAVSSPPTPTLGPPGGGPRASPTKKKKKRALRAPEYRSQILSNIHSLWITCE